MEIQLYRSQLFTAFLTPPQLHLLSLKKDNLCNKQVRLSQLPQKYIVITIYSFIIISPAEPLESVITTTKVSPKEFNYLQEMLENYYVSAMCLVETDSIEDRSNSDFAAVLSAMEQYFGDALKKVADSLRYQ